MLMDALMAYSSSEDECDMNHLSSTAGVAIGVPSVCSDNDGTEREESVSVVSPCMNETGNLQPGEDVPVTSAVDFFNLSDQADFSIAGDSSSAQLPCDSQEQSAVHGECMIDFWNTNVISDDWMHPEKIWGVAVDRRGNETGHMSNKTVNLSSDSDVPRIKGYSSKRCQSDISSKSPAFTEPSVTATKSCFMVHHKIAPQLHTGSVSINRIPKKILWVLPGHSGTVNRIHWGKPEYSHLLLSASMDATVRVWNVFSSRDCDPCVRTVKVHSKAVKAARWSACGRQILSCSYDKFAKLTDVEQGSELCAFEHQDHISCIKFSPVDHNLFVSGLTNLMLSWDKRCPSKPVRQYRYKDRFDQVQDVCFFNDGSQFLSCNDIVGRDSPDRTIMIWDFSTGAVLSNQIYQERYTCTRLGVHPTEGKFFAQTNGDYIAEFSALPPYRINKCKRFEGHKVSGYSVGFDVSPDGKLVASGSSDSRMLVYDYRLACMLRSLPVSDVNDVVLDVAWHPVLFSTIAASTWNGHVIVWQ